MASDLSRSRSASKDFTISAQKKVKNGGSIHLGQEYESEESLVIPSPDTIADQPSPVTKEAQKPMSIKFPEPRVGGISPMS